TNYVHHVKNGKHHRARFKTKKTSSIKKCLHLLHMDLFRPVTPRSINHEKYTLVIVDEYSRKNRTLIEAARTMLSGSVFSKQYWTEAVATACYTQNRYQVNSIVVSLIEPYERPEPAVIDTDGSYNQNDQADQNDHSTQDNEILNDDQSKHSNHNNDKHIIENIIITKDVQNPKPLSSPAKDALVLNTIIILINPSLSILSMASPAPQDKWSQDKHIKLVKIIGNPGARMLTRAMAKELSAASAHEYLFVDFLSEEEPKKVSEALKHSGWVDVMQEELNQFGRNKVWILVPVPYGKTIIGFKWVFRNKKDETSIVIKKQGKASIRIFLAFATYMNFTIYQMDVKSAFLNENLKEEVYVKQPPGFESSEFPNHVCKLDKALYGLKQSPRAWYETLQPFLLNTSLLEER
ncbi:retrovirus-related pol polyprotein from transposon TNT 1-94, partial [Tanacetum coccineum]